MKLRSDDENELENQRIELLNIFNTHTKSNAVVTVREPDCAKVWQLRASGLGLLSNMEGIEKAVACVEDTAVAIEDLAQYIDQFDHLLAKFGNKVVHYAHIGDGEIHLRPTINFDEPAGKTRLYNIAKESAKLVAKFGGSLSGEHGDGRVRAEFIPIVVGQDVVKLFEEIKSVFDPNGIFNPNKIVHPKPMNEDLRFLLKEEQPNFQTQFSYDGSKNWFKIVEKCNGSGDCRKVSGGNMCPSYMATLDEKDTTRGRANALREFMTNWHQTQNYTFEEMDEVLKNCVSCKACKKECPSNVDMAKLKSEYLYFKSTKTERDFATKALVTGNRMMEKKWVRYLAQLLRLPIFEQLAKNYMMIHEARTIAVPKTQDFRSWFRLNHNRLIVKKPKAKLVLFVDEFLNIFQPNILVATIQLLTKLDYSVRIIDHHASGRLYFSKGFIPEAKKLVDQNIAIFSLQLQIDEQLIGVEPSAVSCLIDEYISLADNVEEAKSLAAKTFLIEDFIKKEIDLGNISIEFFNNKKERLLFHAHCHQKSLLDVGNTAMILSFLPGREVELIPSSCCGMAGSYGYERSNYEMSKLMVNQVLVPYIKSKQGRNIVVANGLSCREQILHFADTPSFHPVEIMLQSLK